MKKLTCLALVLVSILLLSTPAITRVITTGKGEWDWDLLGARVMVVDGSYMPDAVWFKVDTDASNLCYAGAWLGYGQGSDTLAKQKNVEAAYSVLLAATLSKSRVNLIGKNLACTVGYIQLTAP